MELYSFAFIGFVVICLIIHEITGKFAGKYQWIVRLAASMCFYIYLAKLRIIFLLISAVTVYAGAVIMDRMSAKGKQMRKAEGLSREEKKQIKAATQRRKKMVLVCVIAINLLILAFVKYVMPVMNHSIVLPLGISFYTFQAIAYMVDIYGEKYSSQSNFAKLLLYVSWFPQLIQGPINRYDLIETDLYKCSRLSWDGWKKAMLLFLFGAIKRYAIGDALAPIVDEILGGAGTASLPGSYLLFGALLFAFEQYANFSGGIDMAMAASLLFGVKMNDNFKQPYFSKSLAEFWRRWHISLGSWMRDYVFYPFAMSKTVSKFTKKTSEKFGNHWGRSLTGAAGNILVFALVGIWHGPQLHYLAWGLYNGFIIAVSDAASPMFVKWRKALHIPDGSRAFDLFRMFRTFMIIVFAGYFDVVGSVSIGIHCFINTFCHFRVGELSQCIAGLWNENITNTKSIVVAVIGLIIVLICSILKEKGLEPVDVIYKRVLPVRWAMIYFLIFFLLYSFTVVSGGGGFMYAAF